MSDEKKKEDINVLNVGDDTIKIDVNPTKVGECVINGSMKLLNEAAKALKHKFDSRKQKNDETKITLSSNLKCSN